MHLDPFQCYRAQPPPRAISLPRFRGRPLSGSAATPDAGTPSFGTQHQFLRARFEQVVELLYAVHLHMTTGASRRYALIGDKREPDAHCPRLLGKESIHPSPKKFPSRACGEFSWMSLCGSKSPMDRKGVCPFLDSAGFVAEVVDLLDSKLQSKLFSCRESHCNEKSVDTQRNR